MTQPVHIPPGHQLFTVEIRTTWEVEEEFIVAAPSLQDAKHAAQIESDPNINEADETDSVALGRAVDLAHLTPDIAASWARTAACGVVHGPPASRLEWTCEPKALLDAFMDPEARAAAELAAKEANNGQLSLLEVAS